jgi:hypothetical protein
VEWAASLDESLAKLMQRWTLTPPAGARAERISAAVDALNSESKWSEVEEWVLLHYLRIQGRTRLGLEALMVREEERIKKYGLTKAEVLGLHIYTGACRQHLALCPAAIG